MFEITKEAKYRQNVEAFVTSWLPGNGVPYTPCGLVFRNEWGANRYAGKDSPNNFVYSSILVIESKYKLIHVVLCQWASQKYVSNLVKGYILCLKYFFFLFS